MTWDGLGHPRSSCRPRLLCFLGIETFSYELLFFSQKYLVTDCLRVSPRIALFPFRFQKAFYAKSNTFSRQLAATGMFQNNSFNVFMEKSIVTGTDNHITAYDRLNFHRSYNASRPSICND